MIIDLADIQFIFKTTVILGQIISLATIEQQNLKKLISKPNMLAVQPWENAQSGKNS